MRVLNLDPDFRPIEGSNLNFECLTFPGGEEHIVIQHPYIWNIKETVSSVIITVRVTSSSDMIRLLLAADAVKRQFRCDIYLFMPYFPAARQDRIVNEGEALSVKVYADMINSCGFKSVTVVDPHSEAVGACVDNIIVKDNHEFVLEVLRTIYPQSRQELVPFLVSPDAGASKKAIKLCSVLNKVNKIDLLKCDKSRNLKTGQIESFDVYADDLQGRDCIIVDDICDGGGTFLGLADALKEKNCGSLYLAVTHGIFSQGYSFLKKKFDHIFTTDSLPNLQDEQVTTIKL